MSRTKATREQRSVAQIHTRFRPTSLDEYLAVMSRAVFQAGLSWAQIDRQWEQLTAAFEGFEPERVARYTDRDVTRIGRTPGIVHSERKVRATIHNARMLLELAERYGSLRGYLGSFKNYGALCADIKDRFAYVGDISVYYFLFRVGAKVPSFGRWITTVKGEHPRIAEMIKRKGAT